LEEGRLRREEEESRLVRIQIAIRIQEEPGSRAIDQRGLVMAPSCPLVPARLPYVELEHTDGCWVSLDSLIQHAGSTLLVISDDGTKLGLPCAGDPDLQGLPCAGDADLQSPLCSFSPSDPARSFLPSLSPSSILTSNLLFALLLSLLLIPPFFPPFSLLLLAPSSPFLSYLHLHPRNHRSKDFGSPLDPGRVQDPARTKGEQVDERERAEREGEGGSEEREGVRSRS
jgi:hypothetical protein